MKKYNFNAGPSMLPREVVEQTAAAVLDYDGIRDVSTTVDMTPTRFFSIWVNCYIVISLPKFFL